nr:protein FAR-RED IMPAIRED RESPONSE 1-like [Ipomoea batatas]
MGIDLERPSEELHRDKGNQVCCTEEAAASAAMTVQHDQKNFRPKDTHLVSDGDRVPLSHHKFLEPHDGMEFESKEDAFSFYKEYAKSIGFSVIIKASRRSRISGKFIDAKFVCTRYGSKQKSSVSETPEAVANIDGTNNIPIKKKRGRKNQSLSKTDCKACLHVKRGSDGMWVIHTFIKEHNHEIVPVQSYNVQGHRHLDQGHNNADVMHAVRDRTKKMCASMHRQSGVAKKLENNGSTNDLNNFEEATQSNCAQKTNEKDESRRDKVQMEQEGLAISIHDSWQQMGQLNSRVATLDAYFSSHQVVPGVGQMNTISSIYSNQPGIQELGQLNTTAPMDNGPYLTQPRLHGLTQLHFRPQSLQNYFEMPESLQDLV